jgi:peroxiredoxin
MRFDAFHQARKPSFIRRRKARMKSQMKVAIVTIALAMAATTAWALKVGSAAPDFSGKDSHGKTQTLSQYRGKFVVLEWTNHDCPYTKKHYESGNMEAMQKKWTERGVIWLSIISSAPGKEGFMTATEENQYLAKMHASPTAVILDTSGQIGHLYEAKTTPHMFVIDPTGKLIYEGAIDDHPAVYDSPAQTVALIKSAKNYVDEALGQAMAGKPVTDPVTRPYGCSVKYGD